MKFLLLLVGIAAGAAAAAYAFPMVAPRLGAGLGDDDLLPLAPIRGGSTSSAQTEGEPVRLTLKQATGKVQRLTVDGEWTPFALNEAVADGEQIRTEADSSAVLEAGEGLQISLSAVSHAAIRHATSTGVRLRLFGGMIAFRGSATPFALESRTGKSVASGQGTSAILGDGDRLWAACSDGTLSVTSNGESRAVPPGSVAVFRDGTSPSAVGPAETRFDISARPAETGGPGGRVATVAGSIVGGGRVIVSGVPASVDERGAFTVKIRLHPGTNEFVVVAQNVAGAEKRVSLPPVEYTPAARPAPVHEKKRRGEGVQWGAP
jgi:hypothetical protein